MTRRYDDLEETTDQVAARQETARRAALNRRTTDHDRQVAREAIATIRRDVLHHPQENQT